MGLWSRLLWLVTPQPRGPLSARQPKVEIDREVPLGMEALDLDEVDRVNRRNNALERVSNAFERKSHGRYLRSADLAVPPLADDETYATRYARAFQKKDSKDD